MKKSKPDIFTVLVVAAVLGMLSAIGTTAFIVSQILRVLHGGG